MTKLAKALAAKKEAEQKVDVVVETVVEGATPAPVATKRAPKVVKDLTKRDVAILVSHTNKIAFITTNLQFSGVDAERASTLLIKDMTMRAVPGSARAAKFDPLLSAVDLAVERPLLQVTEEECQLKKFEEHNKLVALGYTLLSTRGRGDQVRAAIAAMAPVVQPEGETA